MTKKDKPPRKPRKTFPLFAHRNGSWVKTINGKHEPFGGWRNDRLGVEALKKYTLYLSRMESGVPEQISMIVTVDDCLETWIEYRSKLSDAEEITYGVFRSSQRIAKRLSKLLVGSKRFDSINETNWSDCHAAFKRTEDGKELTAKSFTSTIKQIRVWLNWCRTNDLISGRVIKIFKTSSAMQLRKYENEKVKNNTVTISGQKVNLASEFARNHEIISLLDHSTPQFKPVILLGINLAFYQSDIGPLRRDGFYDPVTLRHEIPRTKTLVQREGYLWPETVSSIEYLYSTVDDIIERYGIDPDREYEVREGWEAIGNTLTEAQKKMPFCVSRLFSHRGIQLKRVGIKTFITGRDLAKFEHSKLRPTPQPGCEELLLLNSRGAPLWASGTSDKHVVSAKLPATFKRIARAAGIDRPGLTHRSLRKTFQTVGETTPHPLAKVATSRVMGHANTRNDMAAVYRQDIPANMRGSHMGDDPVKVVCEHVRKWLFNLR